MIAEEDESILIDHDKYHHRTTGKVLHRDKESIESLEQLKIDMGFISLLHNTSNVPHHWEGVCSSGSDLKNMAVTIFTRNLVI